MISILCPTRNRPAGVRRTVITATETAENPLEFVFYQDDDAAGSVPADIAAMPGVITLTGPRLVMSDLWNACWRASTGDILMQADDETSFETIRWDRLVEEAFARFPDRIVFVYGDDGIWAPEQNFGTHGFVSRRWTEAVGYFTPPHFSCDYGDTWLNDLADRAGRKVRVPILTRHLHPNVGLGAWDVTHQERAARAERDNNAGLFGELEGERIRDAEKLRAAMTCG